MTKRHLGGVTRNMTHKLSFFTQADPETFGEVSPRNLKPKPSMTILMKKGEDVTPQPPPSPPPPHWIRYWFNMERVSGLGI